jgi:D-psicose/D-tagatose/L-ribulose 3-epimerase
MSGIEESPSTAAWADDGRRIKTKDGDPSPALELRFGLAQFDSYDPLAEIEKLETWGFDYFEPQMIEVMALSDVFFRTIVKRIRAGGIQAEVMNSFIPGHLKIVGFDVDCFRVTDYLRRALSRAEAMGVKVIVFGSADARMVPNGFSKKAAMHQLQRFLEMVGDEISRNRYEMVVGIEAISRAECNLINTSAEAFELASQVDHPRIQVMVDFYHLMREGEDPKILQRIKKQLVHFHLADPFRGRKFPSSRSDRAAMRMLFSHLREIGYQGRMSLEALTSNFDSDVPAGLVILRDLYSEVGSA